MEMDHGSRHIILAARRSDPNYHSAAPLLALAADMSERESHHDESHTTEVAQKRESSFVSAARVREILGPAIAARL